MPAMLPDQMEQPARAHRLQHRRRLTYCGACGRLSYDNDVACERCANDALEQVSRIGEIYSCTTVYQRVEPYVLALVKLAGGPLVTGRITDPDNKLTIGSAVEFAPGPSANCPSGGLFFSPCTAQSV